MKKKSSIDGDLRPGYGEELFGSMKANRFANVDLQSKGRRAIYLDVDVAEVFDTAEAANAVLRMVIWAMRTAMPATSSRTVRKKHGDS